MPQIHKQSKPLLSSNRSYPMKRLSLLYISAGAIWLAGCASTPAPSSTPDQLNATATSVAAHSSATLLSQTDSIYHYRLSNGMEVIIKPDMRAPTAIQMVWVRTGSIDEVDGTSGIAHMLEHMMFKGTKTIAPGEFSRKVAALGGQENAFTYYDYTGYYQQVPVDNLQAVMALEADRFANNEWPDEEFLKEREVVSEERRSRTDDNPRAKLFEQVNATAFLADPVRRPVIGWMADIENYTAQDVRDFHHKWYVPANAALVIVGQVNPEQVLAWAEKYYGSIPARPVPVRKPFSEPQQEGIRRIELHDHTEQHSLLMAYKAPRLRNIEQPDAQDKDALALLALAAVLDGYSGARLERALTRGDAGKRLADAVGASAMITGRSGGLFIFSGTPAKGISPETLEKALKEQVQRIADKGISEQELQRVITQWTAYTIYGQDSIAAQAQELGGAWISGAPLNSTEVLVEQLKKVTPAQVQEVAKKYFHDDQLTVGVLIPAKESESTMKAQ